MSYQLTHLPLKFKDDQHLQSFINISQLQSTNKHVFLETKISNILLKQTQCEVYLFKVKKYKHKENNDLIVHLLEPYQKIETKLDSQNFMQDFHYESALKDSELVDLVKTQVNTDHTVQDFQSCEVPPVFMKHYNWKAHNVKLLQTANIHSLNHKMKLRNNFTSLKSIKYEDDVMQLEQPSEADEKTTKSDMYQSILQLFEKRPIWIRNSLVSSLNKTSNNDINLQAFKKCLRHIAYICKSGPWKHCYVKFGYNPRIDHKAAMYQTFEIGTGDNNGTKHYANPNTVYDPTLSSRPANYRNKYQFCDIDDKQLKLLLGKSIAQAEEKDSKCDEQFGWFNQSTFRDLLKLAKFKLQQL